MFEILYERLISDPLPMIFAIFLAGSILAYVVLDGFDLGVGILSASAEEHDRDVMIGSIGPFWDANETWLVMAVGILLCAFPVAHGMILTALYVPATLLLIALILRGVAFEFRAKAPAKHKTLWDRVFFIGSLLAALTQGYMLGVYLLGLDQSLGAVLFGLLVGVCLAAAYAFIGATWLLAKTEGELQRRSAAWARRTLWLAAAGMALISIASPLASDRIFHKWFDWPDMLLLSPLPLLTLVLFVGLIRTLAGAPYPQDRHAWRPFMMAVAVFVLGFAGVGYSLFPYIVPDQVRIWEAASGRGSLMVMLIGALITVPAIIGYTIYAYRVFAGKATALRYE